MIQAKLRTKSAFSGWLDQHRLVGAFLLHGLWKLRWYHTVLLWLMILAYGWGASPYLMVYAVGMPEPGTAPRYMGTVRVEGKFERTRNGWKPPKYFIQTNKGDVELHCGYLPSRKECWMLMYVPKTDFAGNVFNIGYDWYWGIDYIKYPAALTPRDVGEIPRVIHKSRLIDLKTHYNDAVWFLALLLGYFLLIWHAYRTSDPKRKAELNDSNQPPTPQDFPDWSKRK